MFLSAIQPYVTAIIIALIVIQYVFALFCLLKLAYFDVTKKQYILWNLLILLAVFVGGIAFLVYYFKHPEKRISKTPEVASSAPDNNDDGDVQTPAAADADADGEQDRQPSEAKAADGDNKEE